MAHEREDEDELSDAVAPLRLESPFIGGGFAPMILSQKASEKSVLQINIPLLQSNSVRERSSNDIAAAAEAANITFRKTPEKTNQEAWCGNFKSMTFDEVAQDLKLLRGRPSELKVAASRLEVYSDFTEATESWTATALTEQQRNRMRREREHVVRASRPASPKRVLHGHERVSQLQERWVGNLDDPENDSEMTPNAVMSLLQRVEILDGKVITAEAVKRLMEAMMDGQPIIEATLIARLNERRCNTISPLQFAAILSWIAERKGISYAQVVSVLTNHPGAMRSKLEHYFADFGHGTARGLMTVYEFTRFCRTFVLFTPSGRFVEGDVHFLFTTGGEGKAVDLDGFKRLLKQVAKKLGIQMQALLRNLSSREAELAHQAKFPTGEPVAVQRRMAQIAS